MSPSNDRVRDLIAEEAAEWFVANREELSAKERQAFFAWLRTSPAHVEEYLAYSVMARDLHKASVQSDDAFAELLVSALAAPDHVAPSSSGRFVAGVPRHFVPRWRAVAFTSTACAIAGMGWLMLRNIAPAGLEAPPDALVVTRFSTRHGQQKTVRLADNSPVHLNTDSDVILRYGSHERVAILNAGEADFEVMHETGRVFRVVAGPTEILDRGTKFDVLRATDSTTVTVVEGSVWVSPGMATSKPLLVDVDHQVTVLDSGLPAPTPIPIDAQQTTAWLHRQIVFNHAPLDKVAAEFNRYARKPIEIVNPSLKAFEISGVFSTDDTAAFIAFLRSLDKVRVEETATQIRVSGGTK